MNADLRSELAFQVGAGAGISMCSNKSPAPLSSSVISESSFVVSRAAVVLMFRVCPFLEEVTSMLRPWLERISMLPLLWMVTLGRGGFSSITVLLSVFSWTGIPTRTECWWFLMSWCIIVSGDKSLESPSPTSWALARSRRESVCAFYCGEDEWGRRQVDYEHTWMKITLINFETPARTFQEHAWKRRIIKNWKRRQTLLVRKKVLIEFETSSSGLDCLVVRCKILSIFAACSRSRPSNSICLLGSRRKSSKKLLSILLESVVGALRGCDSSIFEKK